MSTLVQLPNGLLDGVDLFNYADIDELRGIDQDHLANKDFVIGNIGHLKPILTKRLLSLQTKEGLAWQGDIKDAIEKLPTGDLETILVKIRENTYGTRYYYNAQCPHCEHVNKDFRLDLDKLELEIMSLEEMIKPKVVHLPKMKVDVELKPIYLKDLFDIIKITNSKHDSLVTSLLCVSIKRIGLKTKITAADIADIPASDINFLQEEINKTKLEGHIDTMITNECTACGKEFDQKMQVYDASFFYPTKV